MPKPLKQAAPLSVRLTTAERESLVIRAGSLTLSAFVKQVLFDGAPPARSGLAAANRTLLAHLLATLGASNIAPNLDLLAKEAEAGNLNADDHVVTALLQACDDVRLMHNALMRGLGVQEKRASRRQVDAAAAFQAAAKPEDDQ